MSSFAELHPGGKHILHQIGGQDATSEYVQFHHPSIMKKYHGRLCIGRIDGLVLVLFFVVLLSFEK